MKLKKFFLNTLIALSLALPCAAQQSQPTPTPVPVPVKTEPGPTPPPTPSPAPEASTPKANPTPPSNEKTENSSIPVIKLGDQIKPINPENTPKKNSDKHGNEEATSENKTKKSTPRVTKVQDLKSVVLETRQVLHGKMAQEGETVLFVAAENAPASGNPVIQKGTLIVGKIIGTKKAQKNEPGAIQIQLEGISAGSGNLLPFGSSIEIPSDNKDLFVPIGYRQKVILPKGVNLRTTYRPLKAKSPKAVLTAASEIGSSEITLKSSGLKYPTKLEVYIEPPQTPAGVSLSESGFQLVRINDFYLPTPIEPADEKIKISDHNKNNVQDFRYTFRGWDIIKYLPEGSSRLVFSTTTTKGKTVESVAMLRVVYQ